VSEERIGAAAVRLCALAARALGWRPAEFWAATPAELAAILTPADAGEQLLTRDHLTRMMEQDHD